MIGRRVALDTIADLLGLPPGAVRAVERRAGGAYAIVFHGRRRLHVANHAPTRPRLPTALAVCVPA